MYISMRRWGENFNCTNERLTLGLLSTPFGKSRIILHSPKLILTKTRELSLTIFIRSGEQSVSRGE